MKYAVDGVINQVLSLDMEPGESVWVQKQALVSYSPSIRWKPRIPGGIPGMFLRSLSGESVFLLHATAQDPGRMNISSSEPSVVFAWNLANGPVTTLRGNFLAAVGDVAIEVGIARKPLAALFGGAGFLLQTVRGAGTAFISLNGDCTEYDLDEQGAIRVSTGNLAAFSRTTDFDIRLVGGCRKMVFGGEGAIMSRMGGPGLVLVQSMKRTGKPVHKLLKLLELLT